MSDRIIELKSSLTNEINQAGDELTVDKVPAVNQASLDKISELDGQPLWDGGAWPGEPSQPPASIDFTPEPAHVTSQATGGTLNTLEDTTAAWTTDQWIDKAVKIKRNGGNDYEWAIVLSNTATVLTFDDDLIFAPCPLCTYDILDTLVLSAEDMPLIAALDLRDNSCGVILPNSTIANERKYCHIYVEMAHNGNTSAGIICRGTERQLGAKNGELLARGEGVRLYAHQWVVPHWDIILTQGVKRFANGYFDADEPVASETFVPVGANLVYDKNRRFVPYDRDGIIWARYTSLFPREFILKFSCTVSKTGGVGEMSVSFAKRDGITGDITFLTTRVTTTRFASGTGIADLIAEVPVLLGRNDEVVPIASRTNGTFAVAQGSSVSVIEL
jgi:hypothetical protein